MTKYTILNSTQSTFECLSEKKLAQMNGYVHYQGKPCLNGHSGLRYTKGSRCVECVGVRRSVAKNPKGRSNENHERSLIAAASGDTTYIPFTPCKFGHSLRFVNSNNCVICDEIAREKYKIDRKYWRIEKVYGLSRDAYLSMVAEHDSSCKICSIKFDDHFKLHIDHCHETNAIRGLLCSKCNQAIGLLNHNKLLMENAIAYLT